MDWVSHIAPGYSLAGTIIAGVILVFFSGWYSGMETGLYRMNRLRLHMASRNRVRSAMILDHLFDNQQLLISVFLIGTNLTNYLIASIVTGYLDRSDFTPRQTEIWATVILTPIIFVFGETVPKMSFYARSNTLMLKSARFIRISYWFVLFSGLGFIVSRFSRKVLEAANRYGRSDEVSTGEWDDLRVLLRENLTVGPLSMIQGGIAEQMLRLPEIRLGRAVTPFSRVFALPIEISREDFFNQVRDHPYSRIPLYQGNNRNIVGVVNFYQVMDESTQAQPREVLQPTPKIPVNQSLLSALNILRENAARMAVVINRSGQAVGIVTIKDLVEEILGDLNSLNMRY